jgi:hypothetical protein
MILWVERKDRDLRALAATKLDYDASPLCDVVPDGLYVLRSPRRVGKVVIHWIARWRSS